MQFWSELSPQARQELLKIDKQTLFEQARKNMYCSRCNGLLLEVFFQIVMYGKSLQPEGASGHLPCPSQGTLKNRNDGDFGMTTECQVEVQDPSVHPWGGLTTTRDGSLTLLDCYLYSKSLKGLQNVCHITVSWILFPMFLSPFPHSSLSLGSGLWQCTFKGARTRIAISWCLWRRRSRLDKSRNGRLWQRSWNKGNVCFALCPTFCWYIGGFLVSTWRRNSAIPSKDEGRGFYRKAYVQVCTLLSFPSPSFALMLLFPVCPCLFYLSSVSSE